MNAPSKPSRHVGSVFDWDRLRYNYYLIPGFNSVGGWQPLTGLGIRQGAVQDKGVGVDIEDVLPVLPRRSKYTGSGPHAVGRIYVLDKPMRGMGSDFPIVPTEDAAKQFVQRLSGMDYGSLLVGFGIARLMAKWKVATVAVVGYAGWKYLRERQERGSPPTQ